jgi:hypothetical protein
LSKPLARMSSRSILFLYSISLILQCIQGKGSMQHSVREEFPKGRKVSTRMMVLLKQHRRAPQQAGITYDEFKLCFYDMYYSRHVHRCTNTCSLQQLYSIHIHRLFLG